MVTSTGSWSKLQVLTHLGSLKPAHQDQDLFESPTTISSPNSKSMNNSNDNSGNNSKNSNSNNSNSNNNNNRNNSNNQKNSTSDDQRQSITRASTSSNATRKTITTMQAIAAFRAPLKHLRRMTADGIGAWATTSSTMVVGNNSTSPEPNRLKIFIGTWNMYGRLLPIDLATFLTSNLPQWHDSEEHLLDSSATHPYHLLVVGTQECERDISEALFYPSKEVWESRLQKYLGPKYIQLQTETLAALHIAVFVWAPVRHYVTSVCSERIKTGWANMVGNKGAVAISVNFGAKSLLFINCHLTAHQSKLAERNANVHRILHELKIPESCDTRHSHHHSSFRHSLRTPMSTPTTPTKTGSSSKHESRPDPQRSSSVLDRFDHVFMFGDTNYRIDADRSWVLQSIVKRDYQSLLEHDQLSIERRSPECALAPFKEHPICFPPTYKFDAVNESDVSSSSSSTISLDAPPAESPTRNTPSLFSSRKSILSPTTTAPSSPSSVKNSSRLHHHQLQVRRATMPAESTLCYDTSPKQRVPSWTDRILWHDRLGATLANKDTARNKRRKPKLSAEDKKMMEQEFNAIRENKGFTFLPTVRPRFSLSSADPGSGPASPSTSSPWWKRKRSIKNESHDTVCWFYSGIIDKALIGVSDHMPVIGIYGVWFDAWETPTTERSPKDLPQPVQVTTSPSEKAPSEKAPKTLLTPTAPQHRSWWKRMWHPSPSVASPA